MSQTKAPLWLGHLEGFAFLRALNESTADAADADAQPFNGAVDFDLESLQIRIEDAMADAGNLSADAAKVLGLAALGILPASDGFFAADGTVLAHDLILGMGRRRRAKSFMLSSFAMVHKERIAVGLVFGKSRIVAHN
jgi:hypothetical protein